MLVGRDGEVNRPRGGIASLGRFGRLVLGFSGTGTDIYVPESMYDDALALIQTPADEPEEDK